MKNTNFLALRMSVGEGPQMRNGLLMRNTSIPAKRRQKAHFCLRDLEMYITKGDDQPENPRQKRKQRSGKQMIFCSDQNVRQRHKRMCRRTNVY